MHILQAIKEGRNRFNFLGQDIRLNPSCGIFCTMNPGYAGKRMQTACLNSVRRLRDPRDEFEAMSVTVTTLHLQAPHFHCAVHAGRSELPDNLKALLRPVSMMVPDFTLIAEILMFSEGFSSAKVLAKKMVAIMDLSQQQLSKQSHYDYGLRWGSIPHQRRKHTLHVLWPLSTQSSASKGSHAQLLL